MQTQTAAESEGKEQASTRFAKDQLKAFVERTADCPIVYARYGCASVLLREESEMKKLLERHPPRGLQKGWTSPASTHSVKCELVTEEEFIAAHQETGSVYFIVNTATKAMKIGHSREPSRRLAQLQTGNSARLEIVGLVAGTRTIEASAHRQFEDMALEGEWFSDSAAIMEWLIKLTRGAPLRGAKCSYYRTEPGWWVWDEATQTHVFQSGAL